MRGGGGGGGWESRKEAGEREQKGERGDCESRKRGGRGMGEQKREGREMGEQGPKRTKFDSRS